HFELSQNAALRARFLRQAAIAERVKHAALVEFLDEGETEDGSAYLVMELVEGDTLRAIAEAMGGRIETTRLTGLAELSLDGLSAAHAAGVVHANLKPDKLLALGDGGLKVLDFTRARVSGSFDGSGSDTHLGTPAFLPPEQALGDWHNVDARSDLW